MEAIDLLSRAVINVTDLDTLHYVSEKFATTGLDLVNNVPRVQNVPVVLQQGIMHLSITLRLPLEFFELVELGDEAKDLSYAEEVEQNAPTVRCWRRLGTMLHHLRTLTKLRLWFDHSNTRTWSDVNERKLLTPLLTHISSTGLDVAIILPKLHPRYQRKSRHFMSECPGVRLHRTLRQRWYSQEASPGNIKVVQRPDFPIMFDILDMIDGSCGPPELIAENAIMSTVEAMAFVEKAEREVYEAGHDEEFVKTIIEDMMPNVCGIHTI
jgi:hypothetical protein